MNWVLVAVVMHMPIKTDLVFPTLQNCMNAESAMRREYADGLNKAIKRQEAEGVSEEIRKKSLEFMMSQAPSGTCIPAK